MTGFFSSKMERLSGLHAELYFFHGGRLNLANAFGRNLVYISQLMQRGFVIG